MMCLYVCVGVRWGGGGADGGGKDGGVRGGGGGGGGDIPIQTILKSRCLLKDESRFLGLFWKR